MKHQSTNLLKKVHIICLLIVSLSLLTLLFSSCSKGPAGPAGPAGVAGAPGATGTANVIYSAWFQPSPYIKDTIFGTYGQLAREPARKTPFTWIPALT